MAVASLITLLYTATYIGTAFAVPAYLTYKAIEYDGPDAFRVREWSMYWTVLAAFICVQYLVDFALSWLPFYYILKLGFLGALWAPSTRLALTIYKSALGPLLSTHEVSVWNLGQQHAAQSSWLGTCSHDSRRCRVYRGLCVVCCKCS